MGEVGNRRNWVLCKYAGIIDASNISGLFKSQE